jgi:hypothetical protein
VHADDDRGYLLISALLAGTATVVFSLIGVAVVPLQRAVFAGAPVVGIGLGVAALLSILVLVPRLGD